MHASVTILLKLYSMVKLVCGGGVVKKVLTVIITIDKHLESSGVICLFVCERIRAEICSPGVSLIVGLWRHNMYVHMDQCHAHYIPMVVSIAR